MPLPLSGVNSPRVTGYLSKSFGGVKATDNVTPRPAWARMVDPVHL